MDSLEILQHQIRTESGLKLKHRLTVLKETMGGPGEVFTLEDSNDSEVAKIAVYYDAEIGSGRWGQMSWPTGNLTRERVGEIKPKLQEQFQGIHGETLWSEDSVLMFDYEHRTVCIGAGTWGANVSFLDGIQPEDQIIRQAFSLTTQQLLGHEQAEKLSRIVASAASKLVALEKIKPARKKF